MKKQLFFLAFTFSQMLFAQTPTPVYEHNFSGSITAPDFTFNGLGGLSLITDRNNVPQQAGMLYEGHEALSLDITANKASLMQEGTISLWFKYVGAGSSAFGNDKPLVFWSNGRESYSEGIVLATNEYSTVKVISYKDNLTGGTASANYGGTATDWHNYVVTWKFLQNGDWGYIKGYVDGVEKVSRNINYNMPSTATNTIYFTGFNTAFANSLYGGIDDIKVFTQALTPTQIVGLYDGTLSNDEFTKSNVSVYPNPTLGIVNLSEDADVVVFDLLGRIVFEGNNVSTIDLTNQAVGTYLAQIKNERGNETIKIVKK